MDMLAPVHRPSVQNGIGRRNTATPFPESWNPGLQRASGSSRLTRPASEALGLRGRRRLDVVMYRDPPAGHRERAVDGAAPLEARHQPGGLVLRGPAEHD